MIEKFKFSYSEKEIDEEVHEIKDERKSKTPS